MERYVGWAIFCPSAEASVSPRRKLILLAEPLAAAFHEATPRERVFFAIQNPTAPYDTDRTSGSLFSETTTCMWCSRITTPFAG